MSGVLATLFGGRFVTVGLGSAGPGTVRYGFHQSGGIGAISHSTFGSSTISILEWHNNSGGHVILGNFVAADFTNWTSLTVGSVTFLRTAAISGPGTWGWTSPTNPFGTTVGVGVPIVIG